jgi:hypothetical protein
MAIQINGVRVARKNFFGRSSIVSLDTAWESLAPFRHRGDLVTQVKALFWLWGRDDVERIYRNFSLLAEALEDAVARDFQAAASGRRENYFFEKAGEHQNIHTVIHTSVVPQSSIGISEFAYFENLGHPCNPCWEGEHFSSADLAVLMNNGEPAIAGSAILRELTLLAEKGLKRRAEQEYLLQNMVKGAMFEAAEIADRFGMGIAVRGTGLLAHMGIESGNPTKSQEFKNKTSKEADLWLCSELDWRDLGVVVHYDPRVAWSSAKAAVHAASNAPPMFRGPATEQDWRAKWAHITSVRRTQLSALRGRIKQQPDEAELRKKFFERSTEYMEEDYEYRLGHYARYTTLEGAHIRLRMRPDADMVGDHDLFLFTQGDEYGSPAPPNGVAAIQTALQSANTFQAQHGGIWYWQPSTPFNTNIKNVIMGAHSPNGAEPLVYIQPGKLVSAAYYVPEEKRLRSVWHSKSWTKWMGTTHSGSLFLNPPAK